jgi:hypothetical protein
MLAHNIYAFVLRDVLAFGRLHSISIATPWICKSITCNLEVLSICIEFQFDHFVEFHTTRVHVYLIPPLRAPYVLMFHPRAIAKYAFLLDGVENKRRVESACSHILSRLSATFKYIVILVAIHTHG